MNMSTIKKIALVTGGSRGLGRDMALNLAKKGNDVIITYNSNLTEAERVVSELAALGARATALQLNVGDTAGIVPFVTETLSSTLKDVYYTEKIDFLINNAGIGLLTLYTEKTSFAAVNELINVHFKGSYFLGQYVLDYLNDCGAIVNISTGLTRIISPGYAVYASMKGALEVLTKYQAKELGGRGIRVNIVAPGAIETDFGGGVVRDNAEVKRQIASITALGRVGLPTDIGSVVAFLCSDEAAWITGQRIEVSGGQQL